MGVPQHGWFAIENPIEMDEKLGVHPYDSGHRHLRPYAVFCCDLESVFSSRKMEQNWLVVWNIFYFPIYWEKSSQLTNIFQRGLNHQPEKIRNRDGIEGTAWIWRLSRGLLQHFRVQRPAMFCTIHIDKTMIRCPNSQQTTFGHS